MDLDPELASRSPDAPPRRIALSVGDTLDLVESRHRVAYVAGVGDRFLALLRESEALGRQPVLLARAQYLPFFRCQFIPPESAHDGVGAGDTDGDAAGDDFVPPLDAGAGDVTVVVLGGAVDCERVPNQFHCAKPKKSRMSTSNARMAATTPPPAPDVMPSVSTVSEPAGLQ